MMPKRNLEMEGDSMTLEEFKDYVKQQRSAEYDKRTSTENDGRKRVDVETNELNEQVHGRNESESSVKVQ